jgi:hypothetical protein
MMLTFVSEQAAQAKALQIHEWMIANSDAYAESVAAGKTTAWAVPYQQKDEDGNVIDPAWCVNVKDRCLGALTDSERAAVK